MDNSELREQMLLKSKASGYYKGLLEGLLAQMQKHHGTYRVSNEVYKKVCKAKSEFEGQGNDKGQ